MKRISLTLIALICSGCATLKESFPTEPAPIAGEYNSPTDAIEQVLGEISLPYSDICRFNVNRKKGFIWPSNAYSSGAHIGNGVFITAAHNVYSPWYNSVRQMYTECGVGTKPNQKPLVSATEAINDDKVFASPRYNWRPFSEDIAFIKLCDNSFNKGSSFHLATAEEISKQVKEGESLFIGGYPSDQRYGYTSSQLVHAKTTIQSIENGVMYYSLNETYGGMSGSPVWVLIDNTPVIVGVHVTNRGAYLLTQEMLEDFERSGIKTDNNESCNFRPTQDQ